MTCTTKKLLKNSTLDLVSNLQTSKFFKEKDMVQTHIPIMNVALSGSLDGGLTPGITMIAGPSKHFKTCFGLILAKAYLEKYKDAAILFYDTEFGTPQSYFDKFSIDTERVVHCPVTDIEQLKIDIVKQLKNIERGDKVFILLDSIGNLASKKEVDDAEEGKTVADMSRAKAIKSLFRMITPHLTLKDIPMVVINHTYKEIGMFPKDIVGGGTGSYYSSDNIWIVGRQQEKDGKELTGYNFIINVEKSRHVKEKSRIPLTVMFDGFIEEYSGLFDIALEAGFISEVSTGWYSNSFDKKSKTRRSELEKNNDFFKQLLKDDTFKTFIKKKYQLSYREDKAQITEKEKKDAKR